MLFVGFTAGFGVRIGVLANMPSLSRQFMKIAASLTLLCAFTAFAQTSGPKAAQDSKETTVTVHHAVGTFDVKVTPVTPAAGAPENPISELSLDKQFHGALEATSKGTMLASGNPAKGAGGYVAMEKVTGTLDGRKGSFVLQHTGTMKGGTAEMSVTVVPDSGTDALTGIAGKMTIQIAGGKHSYDFEYTLSNPE
jgi:hypothetical protein